MQQRQSDLKCPACKRYIGLWDKQGNLIGTENHEAKEVELTQNIESFKYGYRFEIQKVWVCNYGKRA